MDETNTGKAGFIRGCAGTFFGASKHSSSLDPSGPYPTDVNYIISLFQSGLQDWTHFCSVSSIPEQNFADYYQYSSSVSSHGCPATATVTARDVAVTPIVSSDESCQKMFTSCAAEVDKDVSNPWANKACVLGATCFGGQCPVDSFIAAVYQTRNPGSSGAPTLLIVPRLPTSLFSQVSTDGKTLTQQNFIDYYYSVLSGVGGPFPANTGLVISYFNRILSWTAFCPGTGIPYMNLADYFQYSSTVQGGSAQC